MIVIDMDMPNSCSECPFYSDTGNRIFNFHCALLDSRDYTYSCVFKGYESERHEDCPLMESVSK